MNSVDQVRKNRVTTPTILDNEIDSGYVKYMLSCWRDKNIYATRIVDQWSFHDLTDLMGTFSSSVHHQTVLFPLWYS